MSYLFQTITIKNFLDKKLKAASLDISSQVVSNMQTAAEPFIKELVEKYTLRQISLDLHDDGIKKEISEKNLPVNMNKGEYSITGRKKVQAIKYYISHNQQKNYEIFYCTPSVFSYEEVPGMANCHKISFEVVTNYRTKNFPQNVIEEVVAEKEKMISLINRNIEELNKDILAFNISLRDFIVNSVAERVNHIKTRNDLLKQL